MVGAGWRNHALKAIAFLAIGVMLFGCVQDIFILDDYGGGTPEKAIAGYKSIKSNTVDVLIFGNSHPEFGFSPMRLYEDTGIVSYNMATGAQPIEISYYFLKEALKSQTPKLVLLDPGGLFFDEEDIYNGAWRNVFDKFPLDEVKLELAKDYGNRSGGDGFLSVFFPIIAYHDRWNMLTSKDFAPHWNGMYYTAGELLVSVVKPTTAKVGDMEYNLNRLRTDGEGYSVAVNDGEKHTSKEFDALFTSEISESNWSYLLKIKNLCEDAGAELVLVKIPTLQEHWDSGSWNSEKSAVLKEYAANDDITFIDLLCDYDLIDYTTDTYDAGTHLNCRGAGKVTAFLGDYLSSKITPSSNELYDEMLIRYNKALDIAMLESEMDFYNYVDRLSENLDKYNIYIVAREEYILGMTDDDYAFLSDKLGFQVMQDAKYADSYIAVIEGGDLSYEEISNRKITYSAKVDDMSVELTSAGFFVEPECSIKIDGTEQTQDETGLNFVVYDIESGLVVDSVTWNTHLSSKPATRNWTKVDDYLRSYESAMCFGEDGWYFAEHGDRNKL